MSFGNLRAKMLARQGMEPGRPRVNLSGLVERKTKQEDGTVLVEFIGYDKPDKEAKEIVIASHIENKETIEKRKAILEKQKAEIVKQLEAEETKLQELQALMEVSA